MVVLPSSIGPVFFGLPTGLWAMLGLVPFLILYLIRPRPKRMELPSLMFFLRSSGRSIVTSFLRTIYRDLLFFIQIIIALALLLMPAQPYTNTQIDLAAEHTVIVIDTSASSQVVEDGQTRFERALAAAEDLIGKKTSIILAKGTPQIVVASASANEARTALRAIKPTDTTSRIGEAMFLADQVLQGDGRIVVLSDFDNTEGVSPTTAKTALEARGIPVAFVNVAQGTVQNVGFIDIVVGEDTSTTYIRNFGTKEASVALHIADVTREFTIPAGGIEPFQFKTPPGITELKLETNDAYAPDDTLIVSAPDEAKIKVLLITNDKSRFLESALTSSPRVDLSVSEPPIISKGQYDVYILHNLDQKDVLPGTFEDLLARARKGSAVVIHAQQGMGVFKFGDLLPVELIGDANNSYIRIDQETTITRNLELGNIKQYIQ
ncbi:MAG: BatA and WFA domain-containing protein, partial [Nanoarchaeota archaeon]